MKVCLFISTACTLAISLSAQADCKIEDISQLLSSYPDMVIVRGVLARGQEGTAFQVEEQIRGKTIPTGSYTVIAQWHDNQCNSYSDKEAMPYSDSELLPDEWAQYLPALADSREKILYVPDGYHQGFAVVNNQIVLKSRFLEEGKYYYLPANNFENMINATAPNLKWLSNKILPIN